MCEIMDRAINKGKVIGARESAEKFFKNGVSYEIVRASIDALSDSELREIEAAALQAARSQ